MPLAVADLQANGGAYPHTPETPAPWLVLRVRSSLELVAAQHLQQRDIETYLPTYTVMRRWGNHRPERIQRALFPGYVFTRFAPDDRGAELRALQAPHVIDVLSLVPGQPALIDHPEISRIRLMAETELATPHGLLRAGQRVRVIDGPLTGIEGILGDSSTYATLVVNCEMLGRAIGVQLEPWMVRAI